MKKIEKLLCAIGENPKVFFAGEIVGIIGLLIGYIVLKLLFG